MKKHAFLILAHDNPKTLAFLLNQLDDERNDIFIHIDKKSSLNENEFHTTKAGLFFIDRTKVYWGDYTQTNATLRLLEAASNKGEYKYYHLLSGTTICTKSQDQLHKFYDNTDLEYFHICVGTFKSIQNRCRCYYPFINTKIHRKYKWLKALSIILGRLQALIDINRLRHSELYPIYNGMEWFSITDDFARYVLSNESLIRKTFHHTLAAEEVFIQTLAMHSGFRDRVYGYNGKDDHIDASKTYQFWNSGKSSVVDTLDKVEMVINDQRCFFVRKVTDDFIDEIIEKKHLKQ